MKFEMGSILDSPGGFKDVTTNVLIKKVPYARLGRCVQRMEDACSEMNKGNF